MFGLPLKPLLESNRVRGTAVQELAELKPVRQRDTLSVAMVTALEKAVVDQSFSLQDRVHAGADLFCLFGRARA